MLRLGDVLRQRRREQFVGRVAEREAFLEALGSRAGAARVLHVHGPGGIGKTALLLALADLASRRGRRAIYVDARHLEPTPAGFLSALAEAVGQPPDGEPLRELAASARPPVLLVDTYEKIPALDGWLREALLPRLPARSVVVLAGRRPPQRPWRVAPGWGSLVRPLALGDLSREESRELLARRDVPRDRRDAILAFARGYPLALTLAVETRGHAHPGGDTRDLVSGLLATFVEDVADPVQRAALEACTVVRHMTEGLLGHLLDTADARACFEWLCGLSFMETGPRGVFPHDLARDVLLSDLRWRNPQRFEALIARAHDRFVARQAVVSGGELLHTIGDYLYLWRHNPVMAPAFAPRDDAGVTSEAAVAADRRAMLALIERHEGKTSAALAARWLAEQPEAAQVIRDGRRGVAGLLVTVHLERASAELCAGDPAAAAALRHIQRHAPLRAGERATMHRFWMSRDGYQDPNQVQTRITLLVTRSNVTAPRLGWDFLVCAKPEFWQPILEASDLHRLEACDFEVGGRRHALFGHDWRARPPAAWLALLASRASGGALDRDAVPPVTVLGREAFARAVKQALRDLTRPEALAANPLARAALMPGGARDRAGALRDLVRDAAGALGDGARGRKLHRALARTYLEPAAASQERIAEELDVPFSTYRRHLTAAIDEVTEILWRRELASQRG
jgi:hypothetical protein